MAIDQKKLKRLEEIITKFNMEYKDFHLVSYEMDKMTDEFKTALKNFSEAENEREFEAEKVLFIDSSKYKEEIMELTGMNLYNFYVLVKDNQPYKTYPLEGDSLKTIMDYK